MEDKKQTVTVQIFGEDYPIRGSADQDYIIEVASYLDSKMREVAEKNGNKSPARVAILAALNITDELFQARSASSIEVKKIEEKTQIILDWLESKLPPEPARQTSTESYPI
jgi:cell division protein ZapA